MVVKDLTAIWEWIYILGEQSLWRIINDNLKTNAMCKNLKEEGIDKIK